MKPDHHPRSEQQLTVDEVRAVQLEVLDRFLADCARRGLTCLAAYGTLLGTVRHAAYIPWDDDIDVMMPRSDFEKLRAHTVVGPLLVGGGGDSPSWPYPSLKICDRRTLVRGDGPFDVNIGVNIDVFPIDTFGTGIHRRGQAAAIRAMVAVLAVQSLMPREGRGRLKRTMARGLAPLVRVIPRGRLLRALDRLAQHSTHVGAAGVLVGSYQWSVSGEDLVPGESMPFEGRLIPTPAGTSAVLTAMYGPDYMTPPPPQARVSHHTFTAYWR